MKALDRYIIEKFQITKNSKIMCYPKDKFELREILKERLSKNKDADLNDIDVSNITDMGCEGFPGNEGLFEDLDPHNIKIDQWNVSNVKDMRFMFNKCKHFEGKGLEYWNPIKCKDMSWMFLGCNSLKNLPSWYKK